MHPKFESIVQHRSGNDFSIGNQSRLWSSMRMADDSIQREFADHQDAIQGFGVRRPCRMITPCAMSELPENWDSLAIFKGCQGEREQCRTAIKSNEGKACWHLCAIMGRLLKS
jgi:hypothetical protein